MNTYILSLLPGQEKVYLSSDSICITEDINVDDAVVYTTEYLNLIRCSGVPNHVLALKIGAPIMLIRNINQAAGLCNGTRLIVTRLATRVIQAVIISGTNIGKSVIIPQMVLSPSDTRYPFSF